MTDELDDLLAIALRAARLAGEIVMPLYRLGVGFERKPDLTPVTIADRRAEEALREFLLRECAGHGVLGEEYGETAGDGHHRWILDPIDGTKSFIHRVPLFGTLIALEQDGEPVLGVIACHAAGETIWARRGGGTWLDGRRVHVSAVATLSDATVSTTSTYRLDELYPGTARRLGRATGLVRTWGDCYGYLLVASGRIEAMLDPEMNLWDVAALAPIITEAGGTLTTWDGRQAVGESAVATNGLLHEEILRLLHQ